MTNYPLVVVSPLLGARSETFIRRHVTALLPGQTTCIYGRRVEETADEWAFNGPGLDLSTVIPDEKRARLAQSDAQNMEFRFTGQGKKSIYHFLHLHNTRALMVQYLDRSLPWLQVAKDNHLKLFVHAHGYDVSKLLRDNKWRKAYLRLNHCNGIITVNQISRKRLIDVGIKPGLIHVIPCGVSPTNYQAGTRTDDSIRCLAVGRMVGKKAPTLVLGAFGKALKANPDLRLDYIGDGELMAMARHYVQDANMEEYVVFHGSKPNSFVQEMMANSDIFIHHAITDPVSGDEEGLPVAILEAMQHALPIVSTIHAGIPEAVLEGLSGYLVEEGDVNSMAARIGKLATNMALRKHLGEVGQKRINDCFSWNIEKSRLLNLMGFD
jgi:glycosyltransferase involved in cell wall biosynthesis